MRELIDEGFFDSVKAKLNGVAKEKGYNDNLEQLTGIEHHIGEIIYKAVRYRSKKDPDDLVKIAAWALLIFRKHNDAETG